jgi:hypothetical protein
VELLLAAQVLVLAVMIGVSLWGWKEIPADARIRARAGTSGFDFTMGKAAALILTPLVGLMVVGATASSDDGNRDTLGWLGLALLIFLLLAHRSSLRRAAR